MEQTNNCWEIKACVRSQCPVYGREIAVCWLEPLSQCHPAGQNFSLRLERCLECAVLEHKMDLPLMKRTLRFATGGVNALEKDLRELTLDYAVSFSEIYEMLSRLGSGDPAARVKLSSQNELLRKLEELLNRLAESVQEMVSDSHEMALGLCEHYDTLNKIADGCFEARATEDSRNELIAKLGALINKEALTLVGTIESLRNTDEQLKAAYQQLQDIIDFLPDGTFVIDNEGKIIAWNRAIEEITGVPKKEMIGAAGHAYAVPFYGDARPVLIDFINFDDNRLPPHNYSYINRKGASLDAEVHIPVFRGGGEKFFWATASPLFDRSGNQTGAIESIRDITHYKTAENEKLRLEAQLRQSQKMEAVGRLAGGIAHDFNNLLTAIIGYTSLLNLSAEGNPKLVHYVEQIDLVVRKAAKLTKDILTFSRKQIINPRPVDLLTLIGGMEDMLRRLIGEDIQFRIEYTEQPLTVHVDSGQFQQVVLNLITNARDAMPRGGTLSIHTKLTTDPPDRSEEPSLGIQKFALITVSDTGIGMDEKTKERIFEPFYTTKEVGKGTGLGLSIAFGIISQHNGFIRVESSPQAGTRFHVYLPIYESAAAAQPDAANTPSERISRGSETLLLAEDNQEAREVMTATLEKAGYTVITAVDGEEAVQRFRENPSRINLVILDVIMPRKNGKEAFEEIRQMDAAVKAIFTSGYTADIIQRRGQFAVGINFISKPAPPSELLAKVREVIDGPGTTAQKSEAA